MKVRYTAAVLAITLAGCASQPLHSKTASGTAEPNGQSLRPSAGAPVRVALPYTFTRRGVEIRVNSIEPANHQVLVSATLQETRGQAADLQASTLMQVFTSTGQAYLYTQYSRDGKILIESAVHLDAHEQYSISLMYHAPPETTAAQESALELRFPTGKFWSSQVAD